MAVTQGAHHVIHAINSGTPPSKRRTNQPYGGYSTKHRMLSTTLRPTRRKGQKSRSKFLPWPEF